MVTDFEELVGENENLQRQLGEANDKGLVFSFLRHYLAEDSETVQAHLRLTAGLADLEAANTELGDQWEASTAMALRVLRVLAEVTTSGEMASSGYLRKRCGLSAEEWHGSGELLASLICFASEQGFLKWHAKDAVGAMEGGHTEPSELKRRLEGLIAFSQGRGGSQEWYAETRRLLADLEARLAAAEEHRQGLAADLVEQCDKLAAAEQELLEHIDSNKPGVHIEEEPCRVCVAEREREGLEHEQDELEHERSEMERERDEARAQLVVALRDWSEARGRLERIAEHCCYNAMNGVPDPPSAGIALDAIYCLATNEGGDGDE